MTANYDVFLSYARADDDDNYDDPAKSFLRRLYNALTAEGFRVWWDRATLGARSRKFTEEIEAAIRDCERFVLVAGPGVEKSDYVRAEWSYALQQCKPITPILRAGDYNDVPLVLREINTIDARPSRDESAAIADLVARLRQEAPLGTPVGLRKQIPPEYIERKEPFEAARDALCADAITPTVISSPPGAVAVYGLGGIGKSMLATALAKDCQVRRHFPSGLIWVEVGQQPNVLTLQEAVGVSLGDARNNYQSPDSANLAISHVLQQHTALIVLDDVWDHKIVQHFPIQGTACRLLITTRSGKLAERVQGADIRLNVLSPEEGAALIEKITGRAAPENRTIAQRYDGHTLAISLAAKQIADGYADDAADMLRLIDKRRSEPEPFRDLTLDESDKDLNLALSLSLSYEALPDDDLRRRFRQTGVFPVESEFDRAALAAIWGDEDEDDARRPLQVLVGAGLLDEVPPTDPEAPRRYTQHGLLRAHARALASEDEREAAWQRYARHVTEQARQFDTLKPEGWGQLDPLLPHVDYVGDELVKRWNTAPSPLGEADTGGEGALTPLASDFANNVTRYVHDRPQAVPTPDGVRLRGMDWLAMGLAASRAQGNQRREGLFLNQLALAYDNIGEKRQALEYYEQTLLIDRELNDQGGEATTLNNIGLVYYALGEKHKALDYFQQALPIRRAVGDRGGEATTLNNIGGVYDALGEKQQALDYYQQALPIRRAVGDRGGEAATLNNIGGVYHALGEPHKALAYYQQALPIRRAVGDRGGEATTLNNIGGVYDALGEKHKALDYYQQALPIQRAVGDRGGEATTLNNMSYIYFQNGELEKTVEIQQQIIEIVREMGAVAEEAAYLINIAVVYQRMGRIDEAIQAAEAGRAILVKYNLPQAASGATLAKFDGLLEQLRGEAPQQPQANPVMDAIQAFLQTQNWAQARQVYEANEAVLSSPEVERIFEQNIAQADDERFKAHLQAHLDRIRRAKTEGIEAAFAEGPSQEEQSAEAQFAAIVQRLAPLYAQGGAEAVRELLSGQGPEEVIEQIITLLEQRRGGE